MQSTIKNQIYSTGGFKPDTEAHSLHFLMQDSWQGVEQTQEANLELALGGKDYNRLH